MSTKNCPPFRRRAAKFSGRADCRRQKTPGWKASSGDLAHGRCYPVGAAAAAPIPWGTRAPLPDPSSLGLGARSSKNEGVHGRLRSRLIGLRWSYWGHLAPRARRTHHGHQRRASVLHWVSRARDGSRENLDSRGHSVAVSQ